MYVMTDTTITALTANLKFEVPTEELEQKLRIMFSPNLESEEEKFPIDARSLHGFLGVGKDFSTWFKDNVTKYDFAEETDYVKFSPNLGKTPEGGRPSIDYKITLNMAKELAMVQRTDLGKLVRRYLIWAEQELQKKFAPKPMSHLEITAATAQIVSENAQTLVEHEKKLAAHDQEIAQIKKALQHPLSDLNIRLAVDKNKIKDHEERIAHVETFVEDSGPAEEVRTLIMDMHHVTGHSYEDLYNDFYSALRTRYGINLSARTTALKNRRREQGWSESKIKKISKLDAITASPDIWQPVRSLLQSGRTYLNSTEEGGDLF